MTIRSALLTDDAGVDDTCPATSPRPSEPGSGPYVIEIAGRAGERALRPLEDDFAIQRGEDRTILRGQLRDAAHLHGVLTRLTAMGLVIVSLRPDTDTDTGVGER